MPCHQVKVVLKSVIKDKDNYLKILAWQMSVKHPHVILCYDWFESSSKWYIAFELALGGELFDRIADHPYTEDEAREASQALIDAIAFCHEKGMIHRDIKPENFLFRNKSDPKDFILMDFGISKVLDSPTQQEHLTEICGTPGYTAPEVYQQTGYNRKVDVYGAGMVMYAMLSGWSPFSATDMEGLIKETIEGNIRFPNSRFGTISQDCKDCILNMLKTDPKERPSAREALQHKWFSIPPTKAGAQAQAPPVDHSHEQAIKNRPSMCIEDEEHPIVKKLTAGGLSALKKKW